MSALDDIAPSFLQARNRWPDALNLQAHYADLTATFESNGSSLLELCKSFLEMVCITILRELGAEEPALHITTRGTRKPSLNEYVMAVLGQLGIRNMRGASAFDKVLSGHNIIAEALSFVRNQEGGVAHGRDGFIDTLSERHARVYLLTADTILTLILEAFDGVDPHILHTREKHDRFDHLNVRIDVGTQLDAQVDEDGMLVLSFHTVSLEDGFELRFPASELLYYLDRPAYVDMLNALSGVTVQVEKEGVIEAEEQPVDEPPAESVAQPRETVPMQLEPITEYQGEYADKVNPLYEYIIHSILSDRAKDVTQILNLTYTLLNGMENLAVIDWQKRDSTSSKVRLFIKKMSKLFSIDELDGDSLDQIFEWLTIHIISGEL